MKKCALIALLYLLPFSMIWGQQVTDVSSFGNEFKNGW